MDACLPRYNTPSRYLDSTIKSPYGRTVVNQYLHRIIKAAGPRQILGRIFIFTLENTHCRERRKIEEYSSLKVTDSDNNSIKESVEFSEPSFRTNLQNLLEVTSESELENFTLESVRSHCKRKNCISLFFVVVCLKWEKMSAIYSAPGGANLSERNRCKGSFQTETIQPLQQFAAVPCQPLRCFGS